MRLSVEKSVYTVLALAGAAIALKGAIGLSSGQLEATASSELLPKAVRIAQPTYLERLLTTPGLNGQPSFTKEMAQKGSRVYVANVFGKLTQFASAGEDRSFIREMPDQSSPWVSAVDKGDCFGFLPGEQVVVMHTDGSTDTYVVNPEGFVHAYRAKGLDRAWSITLGDPKCEEPMKQLPDGSRIYDETAWIVGPSRVDIARVNSR